MKDMMARNLLVEIQKDIDHIQNQITTIENFLEPFTVAELEEISGEET